MEKKRNNSNKEAKKIKTVKIGPKKILFLNQIPKWTIVDCNLAQFKQGVSETHKRIVTLT